MTVGELLRQLQGCDPDSLMILAQDAEENAYSPLASLYSGAYKATTTWYSDMGLRELTDADRAAEYTQEDVIDGVPAVCLVPVN